MEEALIGEFEDAHHQGNIARMRNCAETLLPFKVCVVLDRLLLGLEGMITLANIIVLFKPCRHIACFTDPLALGWL